MKEGCVGKVSMQLREVNRVRVWVGSVRTLSQVKEVDTNTNRCCLERQLTPCWDFLVTDAEVE